MNENNPIENNAVAMIFLKFFEKTGNKISTDEARIKKYRKRWFENSKPSTNKTPTESFVASFLIEKSDAIIKIASVFDRLCGFATVSHSTSLGFERKSANKRAHQNFSF